MRFLTITLMALVPFQLFAQERDSVFSDYLSYSNYVDRMVMKRDFIPLIQVLGGRDEYTTEQLANVNQRMLSVFTEDFENVSVFNKQDLGGGMLKEGRIYWTGEQYAYFYAILHIRENDVVVINFNLNSSIDAIMSKF